MARLFSSLLNVTLFLLFTTAILGAIIALVGAIAGWAGVKSMGALMAGVGTLGIFAVLMSPVGEFLASVSLLGSKPTEQENSK